MTRLFLTAGKKDNLKVGDIVRTIAETAKLPGKKVGKIALFDKYSFVDVPSNVAEEVIGSINNMIVGGRKVKVKTARKKGGR
jgi:ATP-dependent RNA helicase DeaD